MTSVTKSADQITFVRRGPFVIKWLGRQTRSLVGREFVEYGDWFFRQVVLPLIQWTYAYIIPAQPEIEM